MPNVRGDSANKDVPAVEGIGDSSIGVHGVSKAWAGVRGDSSADYHGGVVGINDSAGDAAGPGVFGKSRGTGVWGESTTWHAVAGISTSAKGGAGLYGRNITGGPGAICESRTWHGVYGSTESAEGGAGVAGEHKSKGNGVFGRSVGSNGVYGQTDAAEGNGVFGENLGSGTGVRAHSTAGVALWAYSEQSEGMHAETRAQAVAAIAAVHLNDGSGAAAIYGKKAGNGHAAFFDGNAHVAGRLTVRDDILLENADFAEDFDVLVQAEPGTVMVLGDEEGLLPCRQAYDSRVAGVVCGAGGYKPGIVLDKQPGREGRKPVAMVGKVYCLVDASHGAIGVGDLLTTSPTQGHAMRASDRQRALGAILGKALRPLVEGRALLPILVALQ